MSRPRSTRRFPPAALAAAAAVATLLLMPAVAGAQAPTAAAAAEEPAAAEMTGRYDGILVDVQAIYPRELAERVTVRVESLTSDAEADRMAEILRDRGNDALEDELWKKDVGRIQIGQGLGYPIAAALAFEGAEGMDHLVLVITRPISVGEIFAASRSADYPFSVVSLDLDEDGEGSGELVPAARLHFGSDGRLIVDDYGFQPLRILRVERASG